MIIELTIMSDRFIKIKFTFYENFVILISSLRIRKCLMNFGAGLDLTFKTPNRVSDLFKDVRLENLKIKPQKNIVYIYSLTDPRDNQIKYIGKSIQLLKRYKQHIRYKSEIHSLAKWIIYLRNLNIIPTLNIIEETNINNWIIRERYWINFYGIDNLKNVIVKKDKIKLKKIKLKKKKCCSKCQIKIIIGSWCDICRKEYNDKYYKSDIGRMILKKSQSKYQKTKKGKKAQKIANQRYLKKMELLKK